MMISRDRSSKFSSSLLCAWLGLSLVTGCGGGSDGKEKETSDKGKDSSDSESTKDDDKDGEGDGTKDDKTTEESKGDKAIGKPCEEDKECASEKCREVSFVNPLTNSEQKVKTCAACADDKECSEKDEGIACVPVAKLEGTTAISASYQCSEGEKGYSCDDDKQCKDGLKCGAVKINGKDSDIKTCGDCLSDDDCEGDTPLCSTTGVTQLKPYNTCIAQGGKKDGESCSGEGEAGDKECENYCKTYLGLVSVCVQCLEDSHCKDGEICGKEQINPADIPSSKFPQCEPKAP